MRVHFNDCLDYDDILKNLNKWFSKEKPSLLLYFVRTTNKLNTDMELFDLIIT